MGLFPFISGNINSMRTRPGVHLQLVAAASGGLLCQIARDAFYQGVDVCDAVWREMMF